MSYSLARTTCEFSSSHHRFPEILSVQVSQLVGKIKGELTDDNESDTKSQLLHRISFFSQSQMGRATHALAMIWNGVIGPLDLPSPEPNSPLPPTSTPRPNLRRVKLALLKSITTGAFIDVQLHAYNSIHNNLPLDMKALFTSSIVIEEWADAIMARKSHGTSHLSGSDVGQRSCRDRFSSGVLDGWINRRLRMLVWRAPGNAA